jgi:hypothetical protein
MGFVGAGGAGNVLKLVVMVLQRGEVTKNHWRVRCISVSIYWWDWGFELTLAQQALYCLSYTSSLKGYTLNGEYYDK